MIGWLKGKLVHRGSGFIILDVGGVGYKVFIPNYELRLPAGEAGITNYEFFIHHHVREDSEDLYGFATVEGLEFFKMLLGVPGVGPKVAMTIMSSGELAKLRDAIIKSDIAVLTAIGGIGSKLATKIVVELKPKIMKGAEVNLAEFGQASQDVVDALTTLGYGRREILPILAKLPSNLETTQEKVTWALRELTHATR